MARETIEFTCPECRHNVEITLEWLEVLINLPRDDFLNVLHARAELDPVIDEYLTGTAINGQSSTITEDELIAARDAVSESLVREIRSGELNKVNDLRGARGALGKLLGRY